MQQLIPTWLRPLLVMALPLLLGGCLGTLTPAPVEERGSQPVTTETAPTSSTASGVSVKPYEGADTEIASLSRPETGHLAVDTLLQQAMQQQQRGELVAATSTLERALRIQPKQPLIWHRLADIRLQRKEFQQADSLAARSNTLAGQDPSLREANLRIMLSARQAQGDVAGAGQVQRELQQLRH